MANIWVKTLRGELVRHDRITALKVDRVKGYGWVVMGQVGRGGAKLFAGLGRGGKAGRGAERLCTELPQAIEAARQAKRGATIVFVKRGYAKGDGQWSTLEAPSGPGRKIPVVPPG
jgi:hypothetical protein